MVKGLREHEIPFALGNWLRHLTALNTIACINNFGNWQYRNPCTVLLAHSWTIWMDCLTSPTWLSVAITFSWIGRMSARMHSTRYRHECHSQWNLVLGNTWWPWQVLAIWFSFADWVSHWRYENVCSWTQCGRNRVDWHRIDPHIVSHSCDSWACHLGVQSGQK